MKKLFLGLSLMALLAGCASQQSENGMGGSGDSYSSAKTSGQNADYQSDNHPAKAASAAAATNGGAP